MTKQELGLCISEYGRDIYSFCKHLTNNLPEADELYQDTFLKAVELKEKIDYGDNPKSYFLSIALRLWKNKKRKIPTGTVLSRLHQARKVLRKELDELLRHTLSPKNEPDFWLNQNILNQVKEQRTMTGRKKRRAYAATIAAALVLCFSSVTPMPETSEADYGELELFASLIIGGYSPAVYNVAGMSGNYTDMTEEGILYRLLECDNVEIFADHKLYLCVSEGTFYNAEVYYYDELTGQNCRNDMYEGLNVLFDLPVDASKANPEKAAEYIAGLGLESDVFKEKAECRIRGIF